jgi:hypothetical protein
MFYTEIRWMYRGKFYSDSDIIFKQLRSVCKREREIIYFPPPPQLKVSRWLLDLAFLKELTAKLSGFITGIQSENQPSIKIRLWNTHLMKGVLIHCQSVQIPVAVRFMCLTRFCF